MTLHQQQRVSKCPSLAGLSVLLCILNALTCFSAVVVLNTTTVKVTTAHPDNETSKHSVSTADPSQHAPVAQLLRQPSRNSIESSEEDVIKNLCKLEEHEKVVCSGVVWKEELIAARINFLHVRQVVFVNLTNNGFESEGVSIADLKFVFPQAKSLSFLQSMNTNNSRITIKTEGASATGGVKRLLSTFPTKNELQSGNDSGIGRWMWESIEELNFSGNAIESDWIPGTLLKLFPNLKSLDLSQNRISGLEMFDGMELGRMQSVDLSGNPLDCTRNFDWILAGEKLVNVNESLCVNPPHQNKAKPILKVYPLVKNVRDQCRLNCSCFVEYIWEQGGGEIYSKNAVNCSNKGFKDFPDPDTMPRQTDTLYLNHNEIRSLERFAGDERFSKLGLKHLYLNYNKISSIAPLEGSDWLYDFQILSLRNNALTEVPVYILENVLRQNKRVYYIDLSNNPWSCDCHTAHTFKTWLLRYNSYVRNVEDVRCSSTGEQVRYMRMEDWCEVEDETGIIELLNVVSILLALLIVLIICKLFYDYKNYKVNGKLPWIVKKL